MKLVGDLVRPKRAEGIHPTAVVDPEARLGEGVSIGPYACIGPAVVGPRVSIGAHSIVAAGVVIGAGAVIHELAIRSHPILEVVLGDIRACPHNDPSGAHRGLPARIADSPARAVP